MDRVPMLGWALDLPRLVLFRCPEAQGGTSENSAPHRAVTSQPLPLLLTSRPWLSDYFPARKDFTSFLVLHVPGGCFLPSSHDHEQAGLLSPATTKRCCSAACSLSTNCIDYRCLEVFRQVSWEGWGTDVWVFLSQTRATDSLQLFWCTFYLEDFSNPQNRQNNRTMNTDDPLPRFIPLTYSLCVHVRVCTRMYETVYILVLPDHF